MLLFGKRRLRRCKLHPIHPLKNLNAEVTSTNAVTFAILYADYLTRVMPIFWSSPPSVLVSEITNWGCVTMKNIFVDLNTRTLELGWLRYFHSHSSQRNWVLSPAVAKGAHHARDRLLLLTYVHSLKSSEDHKAPRLPGSSSTLRPDKATMMYNSSPWKSIQARLGLPLYAPLGTTVGGQEWRSAMLPESGVPHPDSGNGVWNAEELAVAARLWTPADLKAD